MLCIAFSLLASSRCTGRYGVRECQIWKGPQRSPERDFETSLASGHVVQTHSVLEAAKSGYPQGRK